MPDPITVAGLASSIFTFIQFSYKITKRSIELSKAYGELPKELQACERLVRTLSSTLKRLDSRLRPGSVHTAHIDADSDLILLLEDCVETAESLSIIFDGLKGTADLLQFRRAIKTLWKEGRITKIRQSLDQYILEILMSLGESGLGKLEETRSVPLYS